MVHDLLADETLAPEEAPAVPEEPTALAESTSAVDLGATPPGGQGTMITFMIHWHRQNSY